jgi:N6-adenosine-specific RNA methylase IME4
VSDGALAVVEPQQQKIEQLHALASSSACNAVQYAIACGEELLTVKASVGHGRFGEWCNGLSFSYDTARKYMQAAKRAPQIGNDVTNLSLTGLLAATKAQRKQARKAEVIDIADAATVTTADLAALSSRAMKFGCIYADPPWQYSNQGTRGATGDHYAGMSVDEIAALPIRELAADNAHLHFWTTNAFLFDSHRIMEAWGFTYKSVFVWVKPQIGMGNYWRVSHEFLLFGVRGSCPFQDRTLRSWGEFKRGKHSAKPDEIRHLIERASPGPRLELFARRSSPGWCSWGNEIARDVFYPTVEELAA